MSFRSFFKKAKKTLKKTGDLVSGKKLYEQTTGKLVHKFAPGAEKYLDAGAQLGAQALAGSVGIPPQLTSAALALQSRIEAARGQVAQPLARAPGELPGGVNNAQQLDDARGLSISPVWLAVALVGAAALLLTERR